MRSSTTIHSRNLFVAFPESPRTARPRLSFRRRDPRIIGGLIEADRAAGHDWTNLVNWQLACFARSRGGWRASTSINPPHGYYHTHTYIHTYVLPGRSYIENIEEYTYSIQHRKRSTDVRVLYTSENGSLSPPIVNRAMLITDLSQMPYYASAVVPLARHSAMRQFHRVGGRTVDAPCQSSDHEIESQQLNHTFYVALPYECRRG